MATSIWVAVSFFGGMLAMLVSGTLYAFSVFSGALEAQLDLSALDAGWIVKIGNIGLCTAITAGFVNDHCGPRACALLGILLGSLGYMLMWARVAGHIGGGVVAMSCFYCFAGQGCIFTYMPGLMNYKNVPARFHGIALGVLDMCFGLSSLLFSKIYTQTFGKSDDPLDQNLTGFLLFITLGMVCVNVFNLLVLHVPSPEPAVATAEGKTDDTALVDEVCSRDISGWALLRTTNFWILFLYFMLVQGTAGWFNGAIGDMVTAFGLPTSQTDNLVTVFTATGTVCRVTAGGLSDLLERSISRPAFLAGVGLLLPMGFGLLAVFGTDVLTVATALIGAIFGVSWCLVPLVISDEFGLRSFGTNWGLVILGSALGPLLLQPIDTAVQQAHRQGDACLGSDCYALTYVACLGFGLLSTALGVLLAIRLRRVGR